MDHRRAQIPVAEKLLDRADVVAVPQECASRKSAGTCGKLRVCSGPRAVQPNYSLMGREQRFSVDVGGISPIAKTLIGGGWWTLAHFGGRCPNRIHTHEVTGSNPVPPTNAPAPASLHSLRCPESA